MEPSVKSPEMEAMLEKRYGRTTAIRGSFCVMCHEPASSFRDRLSEKEFIISGLCQKCQDIAFGKDEDQEE